MYTTPVLFYDTLCSLSHVTASLPADFRGPRGVWTLEKTAASTKKRKRTKTNITETIVEMKSATDTEPPSLEVSAVRFPVVSPTYTHMAIARLVEAGVVEHVVTQNVDGLHLRSGLRRSSLSILHGDCFIEKCEVCMTEYVRDFDICGVSFRPTGRFCETAGCAGLLRDIVLDWDDELPAEDFTRAEEVCVSADLVIALGTSLRIEPAGQLPLRAKQFVIVNLQATPYDKEAALVIRARCDTVMKFLLERFQVSVEAT